MNIQVKQLLQVRHDLLHVIAFTNQDTCLLGKASIIERQKPQHIPTKLRSRGHPHFSFLTTDDIYYGESQK